MSEIKSITSDLPRAVSANKDAFWENALRLSEQRLAVLASNIANADTPNYKARDVDFRSALQQAIAMNSLTTASTNKEEGISQVSPVIAPLMYRVPIQASADGNTVDMDNERAAFADQSVKHQFLLQKVSDEYKEMASMLKNLEG